MKTSVFWTLSHPTTEGYRIDVPPAWAGVIEWTADPVVMRQRLHDAVDAAVEAVVGMTPGKV